jgi:hypothetical protein
LEPDEYYLGDHKALISLHNKKRVAVYLGKNEKICKKVVKILAEFTDKPIFLKKSFAFSFIITTIPPLFFLISSVISFGNGYTFLGYIFFAFFLLFSIILIYFLIVDYKKNKPKHQIQINEL